MSVEDYLDYINSGGKTLPLQGYHSLGRESQGVSKWREQAEHRHVFIHSLLVDSKSDQTLQVPIAFTSP